MKKSDFINHFFEQYQLADRNPLPRAKTFAPTNIALCKYWGKRNLELNLPFTNSLSIALPQKGAWTTLRVQDAEQDTIILNGQPVSPDLSFAKRLIAFLNLFRQTRAWRFSIDITVNIPIAAGLASSACGFASIVLALNALFAWDLPENVLSMFARLGSGSAARSLAYGFVEWQAGVRDDGLDSYALPLAPTWPGLCIGLLPISDQPKPISSRDAMQRSVETSPLFANWPRKVNQALVSVKEALKTKDFVLLGETVETNACDMHATMLASTPPINYFLPETTEAIDTLRKRRAEGLPLYFTQDAGPNLKLLFLEKDVADVQATFPSVEVVRVFD